MSTTLIVGGTVVNATGTATADVLVDGAQIVAVLAPGSQRLGTGHHGCHRTPFGSADVRLDGRGQSSARLTALNLILGLTGSGPRHTGNTGAAIDGMTQ